MIENVLIFRAIHRPVWHWDEYTVADSIAKDGPPDAFRSTCGFDCRAQFAKFDVVPSDQLPSEMCSRCYQLLTGNKMVRKSGPVRLELKAIQGATEGWRPDFMKKER